MLIRKWNDNINNYNDNYDQIASNVVASYDNNNNDNNYKSKNNDGDCKFQIVIANMIQHPIKNERSDANKKYLFIKKKPIDLFLNHSHWFEET